MKLRYQAKGGKEATHELTADIFANGTIGRDVSCAVPLTDQKSSRTNSKIIHWDGFFVIRDCGSRNGTYLNGQKIDFAKLKVGDVVKVGDSEIQVGE